jgi:DNA-binding protein H-NS
MSSVAELLAQKAAIEKQIADAQRQEKSGAIAQVKALMAQHGLTLSDLSSRVASSSAGRGPKAGGKVAPKYRNAATGDAWSGRGLQPKWLKAALATGKKLSDFAL